jgi:hypothetical protein
MRQTGKPAERLSLFRRRSSNALEPRARGPRARPNAVSGIPQPCGLETEPESVCFEYALTTARQRRPSRRALTFVRPKHTATHAGLCDQLCFVSKLFFSDLFSP